MKTVTIDDTCRDGDLFRCITAQLAVRVADEAMPEERGRTRAAVAMILHQGAAGVELVFIQRAPHDLDPWSGHIAFPGGKLEEGEHECQAACRETLEETGIDLEQWRYLGRLSDIIGTNLPVRVSCCLFAVDRLAVRPVLNEEVSDLFWISLADLRDPARHQTSMVAFGNRRMEVPAIILPVADKPVLWGITYRLVMQFISVLESDTSNGGAIRPLPDVVDINEGVEDE